MGVQYRITVRGGVGHRGRVVASVATLGLLAGALLAASPVVAAPADPPGRTLAVGQDVADSESGATVLSDDGLTAVYQDRLVGDGSTPWQVLARRLPDGAPRVANREIPAQADATAPTTDAAGDRIGYAVDFHQLNQQDAPVPFFRSRGDNQFDVGETPITGRADDLRYQRTEACNPVFADRNCGPRLSGDGRTVAFPAVESIASPYIMPGPLPASGAGTFTPQTDGGGNYLPLVDVGFASNTRFEHVTINIVNTGVTFTDAPTIQGDANFTVVPNETTEDKTPDCVGHFASGEHCNILIEYDPSGCGDVQTNFAQLQTHADTPAGNTAMEVVGSGCVTIIKFAPGGSGGGASTALAPLPGGPCTTRPNPPLASSISFEQHPDAPVGVYGELPPRSIAYRAWTVTNPSTEQPATVEFASSGCEFSLDESVPDVAGMPTCRNFTGEGSPAGSVLQPGQSCTAFVRFEPRGVEPYAAGLNLFTNGQDQFTRFSGYGGDRVVLARTDTRGDGSFAGAPVVVSAGDGDTAALNGVEPSVSNDGNLIAFASTCAPATDLTLPAATVATCGGASNVYLRDLAAKTTTLVSLIRAGTSDQAAPNAIQPSLSGDGGRVAFGTLRVVDQDDAPSFLGADQVYVRDLGSARTVVASARASDGDAAQPGSQQASLSRDGSTVGYASTAGDLLAQPLPAGRDRVFVRDLGPDFGGPGPRANEEVSVGVVNGDPVDGPGSERPAVNGDGGMIAFESAAQLTNAELPGTEGGKAAYVRARFGHVDVDPGSLTYPTTQTGSTSGPRTVTLTNGGPGPIRLTTGVTGPYQIVNPQTCPVLHRGQSCTVQVVAVPTEPGPQRGSLDIPNRGDLEPGDTVSVPLTGRAISPLITVTPTRTAFPVQLVGATSRPIVVTVRNISPIPLGITAGYTPATPNFTVRANTCTGTLPPARTCTISVTYTPRTVGAHTGTLSLTVANGPHEVAFTQTVPATGRTRVPALTIVPGVLTTGQVAVVSGTDFAPNQQVTITWSAGIGDATATTDAAGRLSTQLITLRGDLLGPRSPTASATGLPTVKGPTVLVVPGSQQPPDFGFRH
jgi:Abnormal spindle-like microcephaly-assoc'd, ASPM-SPD-2-Hydin/WD40-like Beta Propeller Repeat